MDTKYIGFFFASLLKLILFLGLCLCLKLFVPKVADETVSSVVCTAGAALFTYVFLMVIEKNKRSFLSTGYALENFLPPLAVGLGVTGAAVLGEYVLGALTTTGVDSGANPKQALVCMFALGIFPAIVFFGYVYHIICDDFGRITGAVICPVLYMAYECFVVSPEIGVLLSEGELSDPRIIPILLNIFFTGADAALLVLFFGDMRSAVSFMGGAALARGLVISYLNPMYKGSFMGYNSLGVSFVLTAALGIAFIVLLTSIIGMDDNR